MSIPSIRSRIALSFSLMLALLGLVTAVALISGRAVISSFERHEDAYDVVRRVTEAGDRATLMQLGIERYTRTEIVADRKAAHAALGALQAALQSAAGDLPPEAMKETERLQDVLEQVATAIVARRITGAGVADAAITLNTALTAIHETAGRLHVEDADPTVLRLQSSAQRSSLFALSFEGSDSLQDLAAAESESTRDLAEMNELARLFANAPRLQRQLAAATIASGQLRNAIEGLGTETKRRTEAMGQFNASVARIRAALATARQRVDSAGSNAERTLLSSVNQSAYAMIVVAGVAVALGLVLFAALNRACVLPLTALVASVRGIASGELKAAIPHAARADEIGEVARAVVMLQERALRARTLEAEAAASANAVAVERQRVATQKADATEKALGGVAHTIGRTAERLLVAADSLNGIAGRTSLRAGSVVAGSQQSRVSAEGVGAAAERLVASVAQMAREVSHAAGVTTGAARDAGRTEGAVRALSEAAVGIEDATRLIAQVAGRTKLLALNAAIEAAHAGEAGRGFQVVATEVKALATQTAAATVQIDRQMEAMKLATDEAIETIDAIRNAIGSVDHLANHTVSAVEEQHVTMRGIAEAAGASAVAASDVAAAMQAVVADASEAARSVDNLRIIAAEVSTQGNLLEGELRKVVRELRAA